ncbi:MAG: hypothetical protein ACPGJV_07300 [Bacteriovoracaceae bacterium]
MKFLFKILHILVLFPLVAHSLTKTAESSSAQTKMSKKWHQLHKLIDKEIRTINHLKRKGPRLEYRLLELHTEKINLLKEKENAQFLNSDGKRAKSSFFKKSIAHTKKTEQFGLNLIRRYPNFIKNAQIYYTLALNSRDFGHKKKVKTYLLKALKLAPSGDPIVYDIKLAIAEQFYNDKKYRPAVNYYRDVLRNKDDNWLSKHHFNVAWCYLKLVNYQKALDHLKTAHNLSKKPGMADVREQVFNSAPIFYLYAGKVQAGVKFLLKNAKQPGKYLSKLASLTAERGALKDSEYVLRKAFKKALSDKNADDLYTITLKMFEIFRSYKQNKKHFKTAKLVRSLRRKIPMPKHLVAPTMDQLKGQVGYLQIRLKAHPNRKKQFLYPIIAYFDLMIDITPKETDQYRYLQGETYYLASEKKPALESYLKAMAFTQKTSGNIKLKQKIIDALFYSLEDIKFDDTNYRQNLYTKAYNFYLNYWPKNKKSEVIYQKLFKIYILQGKDALAYKTFQRYQKSYPANFEKQRALMAMLIDRYVKTKNIERLSHWMIQLDSGYLKFERSYIEKGLILLGQILFEQYENQRKKKEYDNAVEGYQALYENETYPRKIKANAAFRIALIELERSHTQDSFKWIKNYLSLSDFKEVQLAKENLFRITENILLLQDFKTASAMSLVMGQKFCKKPSKTLDQFVKFAITLPVYEKDFKKTILHYRKLSQCAQKKLVNRESLETLIDFSTDQREYGYFLELHRSFKNQPQLINKFSTAMLELYWDATLNNKHKLSHFAMSELKSYASKKKAIVSNQLTHILHFERFQGYVDGNKFLFQSQNKFKEDVFNSDLVLNLKKIEQIDSEANRLLNYKHPVISLFVFSKLKIKYEELSNELKKVSVKNMPKEFIKSFNQQIQNITSSLDQKAREYQKFSNQASVKEGIFNQYGIELTNLNELSKNYHFEYPASEFLFPVNRFQIQEQTERSPSETSEKRD